MKDGEKNLGTLLSTLYPEINAGEYVFVSVASLDEISLDTIIGFFKEKEGQSIVLLRKYADDLGLEYKTTYSWISLNVHSSLEAVGLTAAFSDALATHGISCNVIAAYFHDHIFVNKKDAQRALKIIETLSKK